jgi:hypothetical protein
MHEGAARPSWLGWNRDGREEAVTANAEGRDPYDAVLVDLAGRRDEIERTIQVLEAFRADPDRPPRPDRWQANADPDFAARVRDAALEEAAELVERRVSESDWFDELQGEGRKIAAAIRALKP